MSPLGHAARVLIVDDNPALLANLEEILEEEGYQVRTAKTCAEAEQSAGDLLDIALVDIKLPDGDGTTLARRIKALQPECEVILLTGNASVDSAASAVRSGAWAYLIKPCSTPALLLTVEQALKQVKLHAEKRELARRAQVAEKLAAVGTLTAGLSHEIRNPLNAASLQLQVLDRRLRKLPLGLQPSLLEPLTLVRDEIRRLDHVLEDFLQFARPTQFTAEPVALGPVLRKVSAFLEGDASTRGVHLECLVDSVPDVAGEEGRLRQVFMNLTLNALDAAGPGGWVRVECAQEPKMIAVSVTDSGAGIAPEAFERLFEPFFTSKSTGSGLGLPIVHAIVTQHGGTITADNLPGGGARFLVRLPRARPA